MDLNIPEVKAEKFFHTVVDGLTKLKDQPEYERSASRYCKAAIHIRSSDFYDRQKMLKHPVLVELELYRIDDIISACVDASTLKVEYGGVSGMCTLEFVNEIVDTPKITFLKFVDHERVEVGYR